VQALDVGFLAQTPVLRGAKFSEAEAADKLASVFEDALM
jgi:hypothetical protein